MSSAFGDPPDSGKKSPAEAPGALSSEPTRPATAAQPTERQRRRLALLRPTGAAVYRWAGREGAVADRCLTTARSDRSPGLISVRRSARAGAPGTPARPP